MELKQCMKPIQVHEPKTKECSFETLDWVRIENRKICTPLRFPKEKEFLFRQPKLRLYPFLKFSCKLVLSKGGVCKLKPFLNI